MSKRLKEDEIKYIVTAETDRAQKEIASLAKETNKLKREERERRKAMIELEAQGKKNSDEYRRLSKETKDYTKQISDNNKKMDEMRKKLDINAMTMAQLRKQAKELRLQLDNTSKALNPDEYAKLEKQLRNVDERMVDLRESTKSLLAIAKSENTISTMFGMTFVKAAEYIGKVIDKFKEFALEGIEMAASADGVTNAFRRMDDGAMLNNLRQATKGTVNDIELMKAAVQAKDFRIPLDDLGKYLQYAQLKAQETGQSVDYMTNSIITGLGRKSLLILDNLGLSAAEINEQVAKTGDFMTGVANIIDKRLAEAGNTYVSAADRAMQKTVKLQNAQRDLGEILLPLKERWDETYGSAQVGTMELIGWIVKHRAAIGVLSTALLSYVGTQKIVTLWNTKHASSTLASVAAEKLQAISVALSRKAFLAKLIVMDLYRGRCNLATAATEMFNLVLRASPIGIFTTLITTAAAAYLLFRNRTSAVDKSVSELNKKLAIERTSLNNIFNELKKTNPSTSERRRLIEELNDKYPGLLKNYNLEKASLQEITRAQNEATAALTNRIATEMKAEALQSVGEKHVKTQMNATQNIMKAFQETLDPEVYQTIESNLRDFLEDSSKSLEDMENKYDKIFHMPFSGTNSRIVRASFNALRKSQKALISDIKNVNNAYQPFLENLDKTNQKTDEEIKKNVIATSKIVELEREKQNVQETWLEDTDENIDKKNKEIDRIDLLIKRYKELGRAQKDNNPISISIKNYDSTHAEEINAIRQNGLLKQQTEEEINLTILASDKKYYQNRITLLEGFISTEKNASKRADYQKQIIDSKTKLLNTEVNLERQSIATIEKLRNEDLSREAEVTKSQQIIFTKQLADKKITREQFDMLMLSLDNVSAEMRLAIEERYLNDVNDLELNNGQLKADAVKKANEAVLAADLNAANARAAQQEKLNDLIKDFKGQFKITTVQEDLDAQKQVLDAVYKARLDMARKEGLDTTELTSAYNRAAEQLEADHQTRIQSVRDQYGVSTQQERYDAELAQLKAARDQGLILEEDYEKAVQNLKRDSYKQQFDYYSNLFANAVNALQQAEMDNIDAKYDAEIEAAQGNAEEVARLEKEKAQKKLDVEKKYADVNFAIKASQIIADTAVSIMKALSDLGPIAGPIAAALMGVTGAAQLVSANAERKKVKNMTLSGSSSSGGGARVATGREEGGKIDVRRAQDGKFFPDADYDPDARGFIDRPTVIVGEGPAGRSKEWVASNAAVENPTVAPVLDILDKSQQAGTIRTLDLNRAIQARMAGFASGGSITPTITPDPQTNNNDAGSAIPLWMIEKLANAIISLEENGVAASVALTELEQKQQLRDRSRAIGSKL